MKALKYIKTILAFIFLPFVMIYYLIIKRKSKSRLFELSFSVWLLFFWLIIIFLVAYLIFPDFIKTHSQIISSLFLILFGATFFTHQLLVYRGFRPDPKKSYSEWYVDSLPKGRLWKFILGRKRAIGFTSESIRLFNIPLMILCVILVILGIYLLIAALI